MTLRGRSDAELLLETYVAEGRDALRKLAACSPSPSGIAQTGELFCARDPFGIKPFYYALPRAAGQVFS